MSPQWIGRGLFWHVSVMTITMGLLNFGTGLWLIPKFGMYGAIASTLITYTISIFVNGGMAVWCEVRLKRMQRLVERKPLVTAGGVKYD
jgi:O-antigen/teichoic acid export membrane protein